ncbi:MAG: class-II fumarase/aspartase family protein [Marinosulfonomonas sp.]
MPASPFDSPLYKDLFFDAEVGKLFTDSAEIRAMMVVEGALAKAQGELGVIPELSAAAINRAALEIQLDPGALAKETGQSAVPVPAMAKAFRSEMQAPEHAQYLHWGATSQDIMDTALMLRLRQVVAIYGDRLTKLTKALGRLAETHADLPLAGRTYGQVATPTSFGAVVAAWGTPLLRHLERLEELKPRLLQASLSGAAGTLSAMGDSGPALREEFANSLGLAKPQASWHSTRDTIAEFAGWMTLLSGTLGKMGEDLIQMTQSGIQEVTLATSGGSSTMPQKTNPVLPSILVALAHQNTALNAAISGAMVHRQQRDGSAWFVEWMSLPQMCMVTARALGAAADLAETITPNRDRMAAGLDDGLGLIYAEALTFALTQHMPRPGAQSAVKELCLMASEQSKSLSDLAAERWPETDFGDLFTAEAQLGTAPAEARGFAKIATEL